MTTMAGTSGGRFGRLVVAIFLAVLGFHPAPSPAAAILSGRFAGAAINSQYFRPPYGDFDGSPITGAFLIDLSGCGEGPVPVPYPGACLASSASFLAALVPGQSNSFGQPETLVQVFNTTSMQRLSITFGYTAPYGQAELDLVGGQNAFIVGTDFITLNAGNVDLTGSTLALRGGRDYQANVALSSITVDQAVASVPDLPTWTMLLAGFAMTGMATRSRHGKKFRSSC